MNNASTAKDTLRLLGDPSGLIARIAGILSGDEVPPAAIPSDVAGSKRSSAVAFLLARTPGTPGKQGSCDLILNKRSRKVRQPGDLCCPGGSIAPLWDPFLSRLLVLPGSPLWRWRQGKRRRLHDRAGRRRLALLLATALRESFEEMRLNPLRVTFLGPLPPAKVVMFRRTIYPMVCWLPRRQKFRTNWEVERVVRIPLRQLLDPSNYARYRLRSAPGPSADRHAPAGVLPCFRFAAGGGEEVLWGATYRITMNFLELVFDFQPPAPSLLPTIDSRLGEAYMAGVVGSG